MQCKSSAEEKHKPADPLISIHVRTPDISNGRYRVLSCTAHFVWSRGRETQPPSAPGLVELFYNILHIAHENGSNLRSGGVALRVEDGFAVLRGAAD